MKVKRETKNHRIPDEAIEYAQQLRNQGMLPRDIAARVGVGANTIYERTKPPARKGGWSGPARRELAVESVRRRLVAMRFPSSAQHLFRGAA